MPDREVTHQTTIYVRDNDVGTIWQAVETHFDDATSETGYEGEATMEVVAESVYDDWVAAREAQLAIDLAAEEAAWGAEQDALNTGTIDAIVTKLEGLGFTTAEAKIIVGYVETP
jgi:hypothetical protein